MRRAEREIVASRRRSRRRQSRRQPKSLKSLAGTVPSKSERGPEFLRKTVASDICAMAPILKKKWPKRPSKLTI